MTLAKLIKIHHGRTSVTFREFEKITGVSNAALRAIENGVTTNPGILTLLKISEIFKIDIDTIVAVAKKNYKPKSKCKEFLDS